MNTTVNLEFLADADTEKHLKSLEEQLKHIHDTQVALVEPKDHTAPALFAIGFHKGEERGTQAIHNVAQVLYTFIHEDASAQSQAQIFLVTIEGERLDIEPMAAEEIERIMRAAWENEPGW